VVLRGWRVVDLRFAEGTAQSRMSRWAPNRLVVDYTRTMLAALRHVPAPRTVGMVGLGGGSQVKFLHRHLPTASLEVFEIDPAVLALRETFRIPPDDARLRVVLADAAVELPRRRAAYDLLLVDGYDPQGIPPALSTPGFYRACRAALREGGAVAVNLYDTEHARHVAHLRAAFGERQVVVLEEPRQSNRVAFGFVGAPPRPARPPALRWWGRWQLRREFARLDALWPGAGG
jgi:spermidine synthase